MSANDYNQPILVVDPDQAQRTAQCELLTSLGQSADTAPDAVSAVEMAQRQAYKLILAEATMAGQPGLWMLAELQRLGIQTPVILITNRGDVREAVDAVQLGAMDYLIRPLSLEMIQSILEKLAAMNRAATKIRSDRKSGKTTPARKIVTASAEMERLLDVCRAVAPSQASVLISGESGTGKELFARFIHASSDRAEGTFVAVNCAALPENLLESELFGHEKGAFTGAVSRKPGKFELADGGTILLDEISEMNLPLQAKLLRVLQENEVDRVGGRAPVPVNIRVVATTNRKLESEVEKGNFREDLYYRLNVIPLRLPALRERLEDLEPLARHFLDKYATANNKPELNIAPETLESLAAHPWPGNVRELENIIERAVLLCRSEAIQPPDLLLDVKLDDRPPKPAVALSPGKEIKTIKQMERVMIEAALTETSGNRTHAAKMLGISVRTLRNKLAEYRQEASSESDVAALGG